MRRGVPSLGLLLVSFLWGTTFVAVKSALSEVTPLAFVGLRFGLAALLSWLLVRRRPDCESRSAGESRWGWCSGPPTPPETIGLVETTPSRSAFITGAGVVAIPLWGILLLGRRPGFFPLVGLALAVFGVWLITDPAGGNWKAGTPGRWRVRSSSRSMWCFSPLRSA
ncbi:MAG: DMT family transporter [Candidatus Eisenbacteria bacterium]